MVEPTDTPRPRRSAPFALARQFARPALAAALATAALPGCGMVPKSRMDECHRVSQTLRSENSRLKDVALDLRTQNQDLSQRAVDDARQIAAKDEANERLITSVQAYQAERDKLAAAFQALERQVRTAANAHPVARPGRLKAFASAHPGWSFDEAGMILSAPTGRLFEKGGAALTPEATAALNALAVELSGPGSDRLALEVVGPAPAPPVVRAGFDPGRDGDGKDPDGKTAGVAAASGRFLGAARAARVRDRLVAEAGLDPARVRIIPPPQAPEATAGPDGVERRVLIRIATKPSPSEQAEPRGEAGRAPE